MYKIINEINYEIGTRDNLDEAKRMVVKWHKEAVFHQLRLEEDKDTEITLECRSRTRPRYKILDTDGNVVFEYGT